MMGKISRIVLLKYGSGVDEKRYWNSSHIRGDGWAPWHEFHFWIWVKSSSNWSEDRPILTAHSKHGLWESPHWERSLEFTWPSLLSPEQMYPADSWQQLIRIESLACCVILGKCKDWDFGVSLGLESQHCDLMISQRICSSLNLLRPLKTNNGNAYLTELLGELTGQHIPHHAWHQK